MKNHENHAQFTRSPLFIVVVSKIIFHYCRMGIHMKDANGEIFQTTMGGLETDAIPIVV